MAQSLAVKYRPKEWDEVVSQSSIIKILNNQLETNNIKHAYLFAGASGSGKTTISRIFATKINKGKGSIIEIDAASNNGVENVRNIITQAQERSLDSEYKIFLLDECHSFSNAAWQAFLKTIEEPPAYTIFIFCTTDPQKIPATILNRVQRFNISRISSDKINERLLYICGQEGFKNYKEACEFIAKTSNGQMRDAIATLEKCASFSNDLCIENVIATLGIYSYESFFKLLNAIIDGNESAVIETIEEYYNQGNDLNIFLDTFFTFVLDVTKYLIFKTLNITSIPSYQEEEVKKVIAFDNASQYYNYLLDKLLRIKQALKDDRNFKNTLIVYFLQMTRCQ